MISKEEHEALKHVQSGDVIKFPDAYECKVSGDALDGDKLVQIKNTKTGVMTHGVLSFDEHEDLKACRYSISLIDIERASVTNYVKFVLERK